jgi:hypothetical protein
MGRKRSSGGVNQGNTKHTTAHSHAVHIGNKRPMSTSEAMGHANIWNRNCTAKLVSDFEFSRTPTGTMLSNQPPAGEQLVRAQNARDMIRVRSKLSIKPGYAAASESQQYMVLFWPAPSH